MIPQMVPKIPVSVKAFIYTMIAVIAVPIVLIDALVSGLVLPYMWRMSVVPSFHVQEISFIQGAALGIFMNYITGRHIDCEPEKDRTLASIKQWSFILIRPAALVVAMWIVHSFM